MFISGGPLVCVLLARPLPGSHVTKRTRKDDNRITTVQSHSLLVDGGLTQGLYRDNGKENGNHYLGFRV